MDYTEVGNDEWQRLEKSTNQLNAVLSEYCSSLKHIEMFKDAVIQLRDGDGEIVEQLEDRVIENNENLTGLCHKMENKLNIVEKEIGQVLSKSTTTIPITPTKNEKQPNTPSKYGYYEVNKKLNLMSRQLEDIERLRGFSVFIFEELELRRAEFDFLMKKVDEVRERQAELKVVKMIAKCSQFDDPLRCVYILPALLLTLMYDAKTCPSYFETLRKIYEKLVSFLKQFEKETHPGKLSRFESSPNLATSSPRVQIDEAPVSNSHLSHGETMAPSDLFAPVAKDSQMTMGTDTDPTPVLSNGETSATEEKQAPIAKDSVANFNPDEKK
ncbi:unnamed protein product [Caenorhabditis angaria]|uniref:Uncharacterized protein n=1 Tax=Caenorhabditis angaria TaxID=860376 RepID=A0A9P1MZ06_9PELO|nr:unnamed protein product [Caenorhabditis angaria]